MLFEREGPNVCWNFDTHAVDLSTFFREPPRTGERPFCRLEMKFPNQKEVFYLRHILLHYPKTSFTDCKRHATKKYYTYEDPRA